MSFELAVWQVPHLEIAYSLKRGPPQLRAHFVLAVIRGDVEQAPRRVPRRAEREVEQPDDPGVDRRRVLHLEGGGDPRLSTVQPQHINQTDGLGAGGRGDRVRKHLETPVAELTVTHLTRAIVRGDPDV